MTPRPPSPAPPGRGSGRPDGRPERDGGPPRRWVDGLCRWLPAGPAGDALLGDLEEEFPRRAARHPAAARLWYLGVSLRVAGSYLTDRLRRRIGGSGPATPPGKARLPMLDVLRQDLRFALRTLTRSPGFTIAVILTIALGIGANTAIFTVVNGILLRPLPFPGSDRAVVLCETHERFDDWCGASAVNAADWGRASSTLDAVGVARDNSFLMEDGGGSEGVWSVVATPGFFEVLGVETALGRLFTESELEPGANRVTVLGHGFWRTRFGGDPGVVGRQIHLDGQPVTVIGVLEADTWFPWYGSPEVWAPLTLIPDDPSERDWRGFRAVGRLAEGTSLSRARQELESMRAGLALAHPEANQEYGLRIEPLQDRITGAVRPRLLTFLGAVGLVLLIGCANVANLMLARATRRTREFAVRASLGAGRSRLVRQLLTESLALAILGGGLGLALSVGATRAFLAMAPGNIPRLEEVSLDGRVLLFTVAASVLTTVLFGLAPALRAARADLGDVLKGTRVAGGPGGRARSALVVGELALATMLLVGAGLLTRSFVNLLDWDPGFNRENVVPMFILTSPGIVDSGRVALAQQERLAKEIEALPGVVSVGMTSAGPLFGGTETGQARPAAEPDFDPVPVRWFDVDPGYFPTMEIPVVRGRNFDARDTADNLQVAIVNETLVRRLWPGEDPLGKRVVAKPGSNELTKQVVGVVQDLRPLDPSRPPEAQIYWPRRQFVRYGSYLVLRTAGDPTTVEQTVRERIESLAPDLQEGGFLPLEELFDRNLVSPRFNFALVGVFAAVALLLAAIGTYGVLAYTVAARTHEIGIRIALGAGERTIRARVVKTGMKLAALGLVVGVVGGLALSRTLSSMLYGVPVTDPATLAAVTGIFALVALAACWVPARRASRLDPLQALRTE